MILVIFIAAVALTLQNGGTVGPETNSILGPPEDDPIPVTNMGVSACQTDQQNFSSEGGAGSVPTFVNFYPHEKQERSLGAASCLAEGHLWTCS